MSGSASVVRLFVAVPVPERPCFEAARTATDQARPGAYRWLSPVSLHCTLVFLGPMSSGDVPSICDRLSLLRSPAFESFAHKTRVFQQGPERGVLALVVGTVPRDTRDVDEWSALEREVSTCLANFAAPDRRQFRPHVSIGRSRRGHRPFPVPKIDPPLVDRFLVDRVNLVQSHPGPDGSTYEDLLTVMLAGP